MSISDRTFYPFSKLPTELREAIWRMCLPHRVCELDLSEPEYLYNTETDAPCTLWHSSAMNELPPLITRVCHESRSVAFQAGKEAASRSKLPNHLERNEARQFLNRPALGQLRNAPINQWLDRVPNIVHMHWTSSYENWNYDPGDNMSHAYSIEWLTTCFSGFAANRASIMIERLTDDFAWEGDWRPFSGQSYDSDEEDDAMNALPEPRTPDAEDPECIALYRLLPSYLVVLQVVIIHTDIVSGAKSGLFGPLGDAPVQIISMEDEASIDQYFRLAVECENTSAVSHPQDLKRRSLQLAKERLRIFILIKYGNEELPIMEPAIMFRLCPRMCNHPSQSPGKTILR